MKFLQKVKMAADMGKMGIGGAQSAIKDAQKKEEEFREKELALIGEFEKKIDANSKKLDKIIKLLEVIGGLK